VRLDGKSLAQKLAAVCGFHWLAGNFGRRDGLPPRSPAARLHQCQQEMTGRESARTGYERCERCPSPFLIFPGWRAVVRFTSLKTRCQARAAGKERVCRCRQVVRLGEPHGCRRWLVSSMPRPRLPAARYCHHPASEQSALAARRKRLNAKPRPPLCNAVFFWGREAPGQLCGSLERCSCDAAPSSPQDTKIAARHRVSYAVHPGRHCHRQWLDRRLDVSVEHRLSCTQMPHNGWPTSDPDAACRQSRLGAVAHGRAPADRASGLR